MAFHNLGDVVSPFLFLLPFVGTDYKLFWTEEVMAVAGTS